MPDLVPLRSPLGAGAIVAGGGGRVREFVGPVELVLHDALQEALGQLVGIVDVLRRFLEM